MWADQASYVPRVRCCPAPLVHRLLCSSSCSNPGDVWFEKYVQPKGLVSLSEKLPPPGSIAARGGRRWCVCDPNSERPCLWGTHIRGWVGYSEWL